MAVIPIESLALPIVLTGVALFFASFVSWMVLQLHKKDYQKLPNENDFIDVARSMNVPLGNYMFPYCDKPEEMKSEAFQTKYKTGPRGSVTFFPMTNMGKNLFCMVIYFIAMSFGIGYLTTLALPPGAEFLAVFRFVATAAVMIYLAAMIPQSVWFKNRITGHVIESIAYAAISGAIFAAMWPK
ncbi:hypothetical protein BH11PLA2_BH11PLA2_27400 [soil metagenome]